MLAEPPPLEAPAIFAILDAHKVAYVVVGGYAAQLHGSTRVTTDVDVTPDRSADNLHRLAAALRDLGGGIRVDDLEAGLPFEPDGTEGYPDLVRTAEPHTIGSVRVLIATLTDVIRSKTAAGRQKDLLALPELHELARNTLD